MRGLKPLIALALMISTLSGYGYAQPGTDPNGPDLAVDEDRLRNSIEVVHNVTVSPDDVAEGCAAATNGRSLVRFDIKTDNHGPDDLFLGAVSCTSTQPGECFGRDCEASPECCIDHHDHVCENDAGLGEFFEYSTPHGHLHFRSFANYRILHTNGTVATEGHKQSFCLIDIEGTNSPFCDAADPFSCEFQGIHAGCADVYSRNLPCQYVDVTGLPEGDYLLEITMDPENVFAEANEANNTGIAPFTLTPTPPPPDLVCSGIPSEARYCISSPTPLPDNVDIETVWTPCGGGGSFTYTGIVDFEEGFDFIEIGGERFDGSGTSISGCSVGPTPVRLFTDHSVSSDGIETLTAACVEGGSYQAEFALVQGVMVESNHAGYSGGGFVNYPRDGGSVQWRHVQGGSGGQVHLVWRYALGANSSRTCNVLVNGESQSITFEPTSSWNQWGYQKSAQAVNLRAGTDNTIALQSAGQDCANIDELVIGLQAEDARMGGGSLREHDHAGFRGTGFINFPRDGGFVEWSNVDGRNGGRANLTFRYALGANASRTARLIVNGIERDITFEPTGGWHHWRTVSKTVMLNACPPNIVRIESDGEDAGNIDQLFVTR